jgi:hypothetical protein
VAEESLLLADDRARAHDAQPAHGLPRREAMGAHEVDCDERARAPQPRLAVHRHDTRRGVDGAEEGVDDERRRRGAVGEGEVVVAHAASLEGCGVVVRLVQADDGLYPHLMQRGGVERGAENAPPGGVVVVFEASKVVGSLEGNKLARHDDVEVTVD